MEWKRKAEAIAAIPEQMKSTMVAVVVMFAISAVLSSIAILMIAVRHAN